MKQPQDFTCEVAGQSAVIVFSQDHSGKGMLPRPNVLDDSAMIYMYLVHFPQQSYLR